MSLWFRSGATQSVTPRTPVASGLRRVPDCVRRVVSHRPAAPAQRHGDLRVTAKCVACVLKRLDCGRVDVPVRHHAYVVAARVVGDEPAGQRTSALAENPAEQRSRLRCLRCHARMEGKGSAIAESREFLQWPEISSERTSLKPGVFQRRREKSAARRSRHADELTCVCVVRVRR